MQQVQYETKTIRVEPEYWRDPWSRALAVLFFMSGVGATIMIFSGLNNIVLLILGTLHILFMKGTLNAHVALVFRIIARWAFGSLFD